MFPQHRAPCVVHEIYRVKPFFRSTPFDGRNHASGSEFAQIIKQFSKLTIKIPAMGALADGTSLRTKVINYNQGNFRQLFTAADGNNMWFFTRSKSLICLFFAYDNYQKYILSSISTQKHHRIAHRVFSRSHLTIKITRREKS